MIWSAADAREIDRLSSEVYGIPSLKLMEEAGQAVFRLALSFWKPYARFLVLAGAGNNGGDALVAARELFQKGFEPIVIDAAFGAETEERKTQRLALEKLGCTLRKDLPTLDTKTPLIVLDGLLGLGLKGALREGETKNLLLAVARLQAQHVIAIDLPSGLNADLWEQEPPPLPATHTITFGAYKPVHVGHPSRKYCGRLSCETIGFAEGAIESVREKQPLKLRHFTDAPELKDLWDFLPVDAHKYDRGHVLAIGGSPGKIGAILISAEGARQAGAGWVSVAPLSEIMAPAWPKRFTYETFGIDGDLDCTQLRAFLESRKVKAVLIGPGTMQNPLRREILEDLLRLQKQNSLRLIFDAGALDQFLELAKDLPFQPEHTLLTPHPGEWKRLQKDMPVLRGLEDLAKASARLQGFSVIYKSSTPIVIGPSGVTFLTEGDKSLARAGSGDTLAGIVLGLSATPNSFDKLAAIAQNLVAKKKVNLPEE